MDSNLKYDILSFLKDANVIGLPYTVTLDVASYFDENGIEVEQDVWYIEITDDLGEIVRLATVYDPPPEWAIDADAYAQLIGIMPSAFYLLMNADKDDDDTIGNDEDSQEKIKNTESASLPIGDSRVGQLNMVKMLWRQLLPHLQGIEDIASNISLMNALLGGQFTYIESESENESDEPPF